MGFLGFGKKERFLDLSKKVEKSQEREVQSESVAQPSSSQELPSQGVLGFFGNFQSQNSVPSESSESSEEKRQKFAKRLMEMTKKMEELSNQIYHLQQRIELLERKAGTGSY